MATTPLRITVCAAILIPLVAAVRCGNRISGTQPQPGSEFEQLRGPEIARAKQLYAAGRQDEGAAILNDLARDPDWNVRSLAIRTIGDVHDRRLLSQVHAALRDARLEVRESASRVLVSLGDDSSKSVLREALSDPVGIVRINAAQALSRIGGVSELTALAKLIEKDDDPTVRAATAQAIGEIHDPAVVTVLAAALDDASPMVRGEAAEAIGAAGYASGRNALERVAQTDPDAQVRERARAALQRLDAANVRERSR